MRIISGRFGGRRIQPGKGLPARPTTDRAKEGLFNFLQHRVPLEGLRFLDLFAGTGNISLELVSRGAKGIAIEKDRRSVDFIKKMITALGIAGELSVKKFDVFRFLKNSSEPFDLIFADPPYGMDQYPELIETLLNEGWLKPGGLLIVEHFKLLETDHPLRIDQKSYGETVFSIFQADGVL